MSRREDLETQIVAQVGTVSALAGKVYATATTGLLPPGNFPKAIVACQEFKRESVDSVYAGYLRITGHYTFTVSIFAKSSGSAGSARLGASGTYAIAEAVDAAVSGFQPTLSGVEAIFPCVLQKDELFSFDETGYAIDLTYTLMAKLAYPNA